METFNIGDYVCYKGKIGKGSYSSVYKGFHKNSLKEVAVKRIEYENIDIKLKNQINSEMNLMKKINHPNIVKLYDIYFDNEKFIYFILEYCEQGDLYKFLNKRTMKEKYAKKYMIQLVEGLKYLYEKKIIHRDLKPQNIMITKDNIVKIIDFGFARYFESNKMLNTLCGTPLYMAPEIICDNNYNNKSDLWSIGIILYEIIFGVRPYNGNNLTNLMKCINNSEINFPKKINISNDCKELIKKLLIKEPILRINWDDFFNHKWFDNLKFKDNNSNDNDKKLNTQKSKPINIQNVQNVQDNYINSNYYINGSPIFKSLDNNDFIIINKHRGDVVQRGSKVRTSLKDYYESLLGYPLYIVHRLDKDTSGLMIFTKNRLAASGISKRFLSNNIHKYYLAKTHKSFNKQSGMLENVNNENKLLKLFYRKIKSTKDEHLYLIKLLTGRKHQIRLQFFLNDNPIIGDKKFSQDKNKNLSLSAVSIHFYYLNKFYKFNLNLNEID